ncbi:DegT/DnrJ/EryC1/StrS family aminotransferase [Ketogulonicigenium vulgare]|uniref:Aminotransferase, DegT/DnrJ/EryC1/StrS family protein n=1 Tax=Ketogulonicigenium vulgare (strain WSH-001) TaxID=759362 RepID=F9Y4A7_KETVW|nr:DegT/DnrJ/EryC1/StrS family aminotransferase [Ketogulonicigenium vulgare]AEM41720.1 Aminotransferase, DegT/DnrJ/EryC1/StrS family protein [Ketogulonicigenium vulgare WSH-001]ALJ81828.1 hypothetical protein KVH_12050 [Ketogulonicigenium vulgare]ANW34484.1 hypothetical protein KvSKV_11970 [Ketogulonicigenium vulgare]AOZ55473.1 Aminotransferase, DegT/DnrJ/EryC1/StrS family protein [Ketogulonicigenium vulgare]
MSASAIITVGAPMLPDLPRYTALLSEAIDAAWLTNGGVLHQRLEMALAADLPGRTVGLAASGTTALMMALQLGDLPPGAEVITPAISFAATAQVIRWCGFQPVFVDVQPDSLNICPDAVRAAITPRTAAIMPVHLLGQPCDTDALADIARQHRLWLVYDAAHAYGVTWQGQPIGNFGDATAFSLHATKLLHTGEGGYIVTHPENGAAMRRMRNFGLDQGRPVGFGINGKLSEAQAAMGLALLPDLPAEIAARRDLRCRYDAAFATLPDVSIQAARGGASDNLTYYALRLPPARRAGLFNALAAQHVFARDHFPLLCGPGTAFPDAPVITAAPHPIAPARAGEVICLPFHGRLSTADQAKIIQVTTGFIKGDL